MSLHNRVRERLLEMLAAPEPREDQQLNAALRLLGQWRSRMIQDTLVARNGTVVLNGPFAGLDFLAESAEGCHVPKLLGTYEQPLHAAIETVIATAYPILLNIGCAEGYYAVGLARRMPATKVLAFDTDANARKVCADLAAKNGVTDRIEIGELFRIEDFARYAGQRALVFCDIEGAERELLDPDKAPALRTMDMIVEAHECFLPGLTQELVRRFSPSHEIELIVDDGQRRLGAMPDWFRHVTNLDQLLTVWEWRAGQTPWLAMRARAR
jgi:hypothetical protein